MYFISPLGAFATWRATREAGGFDVRTFEVRARPVHPLPALRPGMSALVDWPHESPPMSALAAVARRELRRLRRLPVLWALLGPIPAAMTLLLVGVFASEVVRDLPVAVLDLDRSATSRTATRWLEATRGARLAGHVEDLGAARSAVLERQVYGVLVVPRHFERDLLRGRSPHVTFLFNEEYLTAGGNVSADVSRGASTAAALLTALSGREPSPIRVDLRSLFNPAASYAQALGFLLIGGLLQVVIGIATIYAVGRELADGTAAEWLEAAGGSTAAAWIGKLAPYTVFHCVLVVALLGLFAAWYGIPVRGPAWLLVVATAAFVLATQALAILIIALDGESENEPGAGRGDPRPRGSVQRGHVSALGHAGGGPRLGRDAPAHARPGAHPRRHQRRRAGDRGRSAPGAGPHGCSSPLGSRAPPAGAPARPGLLGPRVKALGRAAWRTLHTIGPRAGGAQPCSWSPRSSIACSTPRRTSIRCCATSRCSWWTATTRP